MFKAESGMRDYDVAGVQTCAHPIYGGPGGRHMKYQEYVTLRMRIESFGLKLAVIEGGFSPDLDYHDVIFGGPKQDELIEDLLVQVRDMGRAGIPIYGYNWMPNSWGRARSEARRVGNECRSRWSPYP